MRVGIDEPRKQIRVPEVNHVSRRRSRVARTDIRDAPVFDSNGPVANGGTTYRENPASSVKANGDLKLGARRVALGAGGKR